MIDNIRDKNAKKQKITQKRGENLKPPLSKNTGISHLLIYLS